MNLTEILVFSQFHERHSSKMNICSFSAVVLHALDVNQAYHSRLPTQFPEADFERDLMHILSVHFDSLEFSLEFLQHHTMLVIQKTRLVKRYVEEQHPIIFQNISDWLLRMFRQHQKIKKAEGTTLSDT